MNIKTISYQRVKNLGNYESKRLEMVVELAPGEDPDAAAKALMNKVDALLYPPRTEEDEIDSF